MTKLEENNWWTKAIVYEVYIDKFAGNLKTFIAKLDYLSYLGVNTLWLLPHYPSPMVDGGYDISDYISIRQDLGEMADFEDFIKIAHDRGFKIIIDLVLNHTSDQHPWFMQARSSKQNSKRDYYMWSDNSDKFQGAFVHTLGNKRSNWIRNESTGDFYYATFYPEQPDLNWDNPTVYQEMRLVMEFWLSKGVDGFRLDAISRLIKRENSNCFALPETHALIKNLRKDIKHSYPHTLFLAESGGWIHEARTFFGDGDECQLVINFPFAANLLASLKDQTTHNLENIVKDSEGIPVECQWATFLTNHDSVDLFFVTDSSQKERLAQENSLLQRFGDGGGQSFAARISEICSGEKEGILWAFSRQFSLPGVPIIYYGNEIGMSNEKLQTPPRDFRDYVRGTFDWAEAERQIKDPNSLLNNIRDIIMQTR